MQYPRGIPADVRERMLGPKEDFYRSLAHEMWGPVMRRSEVKHALFWIIAGSALLVAGVIAVVVTGEALTAIVVGLLAIASAWGTWKTNRALFWSWRRIGDVTLIGPPLELVPGDVSDVAIRILPRRDSTLQQANLTFSWRDSRSGPAGTAWAVDVELGEPTLQAGEERVLVAETSLPPGVPPSRFDSAWTRQWTCTARVELSDGRIWEREYPVFVLPTP